MSAAAPPAADGDILTRTCPACGASAEYPDCGACGHRFDEAPRIQAGTTPEPSFRFAFVAHKEAPVSRVESGTWSDLGAMLDTPQVGAKEGPGWLPALIEPGARKQERVTGVQMLVLDIEGETIEDKAEGIKTVVGPEPPSFGEFVAEIDLIGWRAYVHTSHSHLNQEVQPLGVGHPRYRVAFALSRTLAPAELSPFGRHIATRLGVADCTDRGSYEPNRFFYLPRCPADRLSLFEFAAIEGDPIDVDAMLAEAKREADALARATEAQRQRATGERGKVIEAFNAAHDIGALLEAHDYQRRGRGRWLWPESSSRTPGVVLLPKSDPPRVFSHHGGDPLADGRAHDAFDVWRILQGHGDDFRIAVREAARLLGLATRKTDTANVEMDEFLARIGGEASGGNDSANDSEGEPEPKTNAQLEQPQPAQSPPPPAPAPKPIIRFTPVCDLLEQPAPLSWLIRGVLLPGAQTLVFGDPAVGKSLLTLSWAASIAMGRDWCGHPARRGCVIYLAGEGQFGIRRRLMAWAIANDCLEALRVAPLFVSDSGADLTDAGSLEAVVTVVDGIAGMGGTPALIVVDTLHRNIGGRDDSSSVDMGLYTRATDALIQRYGCTVLTVHHAGHGDKTRSRGSSAIRGALDVEYGLIENDGVRTLAATKMKDAPKPPAMGFELEQVQLPWSDDQGEPETSVVLVETEGTGKARKAVTPTQRLAFEALLFAIEESGFPPPAHIVETLPAGARLAGLESWRREFYSRHMGDSIDAKKKAFQRARSDLATLGAIGHQDDAYWPTPGCGGNAGLLGMVQGRAVVRGLREVKNAA